MGGYWRRTALSAVSSIRESISNDVYNPQVLQRCTTWQEFVGGFIAHSKKSCSNASVAASVHFRVGHISLFPFVLFCSVLHCLAFARPPESHSALLIHGRSLFGMHTWRWAIPRGARGLGSASGARSSWVYWYFFSYFASAVVMASAER
jgi:hypothetical protein